MPSLRELGLAVERLKAQARGSANASPSDENAQLAKQRSRLAQVVATRAPPRRIDLPQLERSALYGTGF